MMGLVVIFPSVVTSSSSSLSLRVHGAMPHFFLLSASCIIPFVCTPSIPRLFCILSKPPPYASRPVPPEDASGSILVVAFLCSLICSRSLPMPPPRVCDPFAPTVRIAPCLSDRNMLPLQCHMHVHAFPFLPPTPH
eukprot:3221681-Pleurochrysis_carterae.AAC.1